ncbi:MAG: tryptophan--tRNA ligase [Candidatus Schekmanbacteria bacterium]|nr:MAG: tryptophan--tRNA ligase [Candidatus Schekmanbacteria bacterium]
MEKKMSKGKRRVLSGMRPTGNLHLGHYIGVLENWKKMQINDDCFYFVADWHALTTEYQDASNIRKYTDEMIIDWLAAGIDPEKATIFVQSDVLQHSELHLLLSMITPIPWLERVPSYKETKENLSNRDLSTYGFLGYPLLQTADILLYSADVVPVGIDQVPHIELAREIARRFNFIYGETVFIEPQPLLTSTPKLPGTDGRKMSKSFDNCIYLADSPEEIEKKIKTMVTDPQRVRRNDPGNPEVCPVYAYHKVFSKSEEVKKIEDSCKDASIGCVDCKKILFNNIEEFFVEYSEKRAKISSDREQISSIRKKGKERAYNEAEKMMEKVRNVMKLR